MPTVAIPQAHAGAPDRFAPAAECLRRYPSLSRAKLYRLAVGAEIRVQLPPGQTPRYSLMDLARVMAERAAESTNG